MSCLPLHCQNERPLCILRFSSVGRIGASAAKRFLQMRKPKASDLSLLCFLTAFALCGSLGSAIPSLPYSEGVKADYCVACSVYQEIWKSGKLYEYPVANLDNVKSAAGPLSDGWGLTTDQTSLIMSDGSSTLSWVDPQSLAVQRTISVSMQPHPVLCEQAILIPKAAKQAAISWDGQSLIKIRHLSLPLMATSPSAEGAHIPDPAEHCLSMPHRASDVLTRCCTSVASCKSASVRQKHQACTQNQVTCCVLASSDAQSCPGNEVLMSHVSMGAVSEELCGACITQCRPSAGDRWRAGCQRAERAGVGGWGGLGQHLAHQLHSAHRSYLWSRQVCPPASAALCTLE